MEEQITIKEILGGLAVMGILYLYMWAAYLLAPEGWI